MERLCSTEDTLSSFVLINFDEYLYVVYLSHVYESTSPYSHIRRLEEHIECPALLLSDRLPCYRVSLKLEPICHSANPSECLVSPPFNASVICFCVTMTCLDMDDGNLTSHADSASALTHWPSPKPLTYHIVSLATSSSRAIIPF